MDRFAIHVENEERDLDDAAAADGDLQTEQVASLDVVRLDRVRHLDHEPLLRIELAPSVSGLARDFDRARTEQPIGAIEQLVHRELTLPANRQSIHPNARMHEHATFDRLRPVIGPVRLAAHAPSAQPRPTDAQREDIRPLVPAATGIAHVEPHRSQRPARRLEIDRHVVLARERRDPRTDRRDRCRSTQRDPLEQRPEPSIRPDHLRGRVRGQPRRLRRCPLHRLLARGLVAPGRRDHQHGCRDHRAEPDVGTHADPDTAPPPGLRFAGAGRRRAVSEICPKQTSSGRTERSAVIASSWRHRANAFLISPDVAISAAGRTRRSDSPLVPPTDGG
jgi:hypothetical protein